MAKPKAVREALGCSESVAKKYSSGASSPPLWQARLFMELLMHRDVMAVLVADNRSSYQKKAKGTSKKNK